MKHDNTYIIYILYIIILIIYRYIYHSQILSYRVKQETLNKFSSENVEYKFN